MAMSREEKAQKAKAHVELMQSRYPGQIKASIDCTTLHAQADVVGKPKVTQQFVLEADTVKALLYARQAFPDKKIAVVNFASYLNPGGGFLTGSMAQEEAICHESTLYNVLNQKRDWYDTHSQAYSRNENLYSNQAMYTPDVYFERDDRVMTADVITVAAPNANAYHGKSENVKLVMKSRIEFLRDIARQHEVDVLIFGAFGCGAFGNEPEVVSRISVNVFNNCGIPIVAYAIPDKGSRNYIVYDRVVKCYQGMQMIL